MKTIFTLYLKKAFPPGNNAHAVLDLPAAPYEVQDALDRLRLGENSSMVWEITEYPRFEELKTLIDRSGSLYELNALAQKLSELDETQGAIFAGLVKMENAKGPIPLPRLIDLAYSTDCCHVCHDALNDSQLGRIRAESGCVPGLDKLTKEAFEILDFEQIGRRARVSEKGVFVKRSMDHPGGYVALDSPLMETAKTLDLTPKTPDYAMLLEVSYGDSSVQLKLPASEQELEAVPQALDEPDWLDLTWTCLDCKVPSLADAVSEARDIHSVNDFAKMLAEMDHEDIVTYKALLEASNCQDLLRAGLLADQIPKYIFSPQFSSPEEMAKEELSVLLCDPDAETILPYVNLQKYGEALIEKSRAELTGYGLIERADGQPIQSPRQGGMTLG
nr:antirestriction protein ArdA [uncultured Oscillibacter sp.]